MRQPLQVNIWLEIIVNISIGLVGTRCNTSGVAEANLTGKSHQIQQVIQR